jgi:hypothetical protein
MEENRKEQKGKYKRKRGSIIAFGMGERESSTQLRETTVRHGQSTVLAAANMQNMTQPTCQELQFLTRWWKPNGDAGKCHETQYPLF